MTTPVATVAPISTITTWKLDPSHTTIEFAVKHMMVSTAKGQFTKFEGEIVADEAHPEKSSVNVTIDAASLTTRDERRDGHLRSADFFDVENHPNITFKSTKVTFSRPEKFQVVGDLTIRGITKSVTLDVNYEGTQTNPWGGKVSGFNAQGKINRLDWGLNWNAALEAGGWLVGNDVRLSIEAEANPA